MDKITTRHLSRLAYVYIRQSTLGQLQHNTESRRVQERLLERAQSLGWHRPRLIDEDLGCSGSGVVERAGFERLLAAVCAGEVGAIFAFEASRLARNGREWHTLLEMCALVDTLITDPNEWAILIREHHPGYISWEQYEQNTTMLNQNVNMKGSMRAGGVRGGASVFAGILRCGACGRKVLVGYSGMRARSIRYSCSTNSRQDDGERCVAFSANTLERVLTDQLLETV